jgi:hypothetical protein
MGIVSALWAHQEIEADDRVPGARLAVLFGRDSTASRLWGRGCGMARKISRFCGRSQATYSNYQTNDPPSRRWSTHRPCAVPSSPDFQMRNSALKSSRSRPRGSRRANPIPESGSPFTSLTLVWAFGQGYCMVIPNLWQAEPRCGALGCCSRRSAPCSPLRARGETGHSATCYFALGWLLSCWTAKCTSREQFAGSGSPASSLGVLPVSPVHAGALMRPERRYRLATFRRKIRGPSSVISMTGAPRNCTNGRILP